MEPEPAVVARPLSDHGTDLRRWAVNAADRRLVRVDRDKLGKSPETGEQHEDIQRFVREHMLRSRSVTFMQSMVGTGKSTLMLDVIAEEARMDAAKGSPPKKQLLLSCNRMFARDFARRALEADQKYRTDSCSSDQPFQLNYHGVGFADYTVYSNHTEDNKALLGCARSFYPLESLLRLVHPDTKEVPRLSSYHIG